MGRGLVREDVNVIMFDEPLTVIDPHLKWQLRSKLKELHQRLRATMIYVTHDQTEALTFADQVVVMNEGEVVQIGTPGRALRAPGAHLRRPLHRLARHERAALRACATARPGSHGRPRRDGATGAGRRPARDRRPPGVRVDRRRRPAGGGRLRVADIGRHRVVEARAGGRRVNALLPEGIPVGARAGAPRVRARRRPASTRTAGWRRGGNEDREPVGLALRHSRCCCWSPSTRSSR